MKKAFGLTIYTPLYFSRLRYTCFKGTSLSRMSEQLKEILAWNYTASLSNTNTDHIGALLSSMAHTLYFNDCLHAHVFSGHITV